MNWLNGQRFGNSLIGKSVRKTSGKGASLKMLKDYEDICVQKKHLLRCSKTMKTSVSHVNAHPEVTSDEEVFSNHVDRMTYFVDSQFLSLDMYVIAQRGP